MGDSDNYENVFWEVREEDYAGVFASENLQSNHPYQSADQSFNAQGSAGPNSIVRVSPHTDHQEGETENDRDSNPSQSSLPIGLRLTKTASFMDLLQKTIDKATNTDELAPPPPPPPPTDQKLKASNFPAFYIRIGTWERITRNEGDLTAKMYYAKKKLVWEVLEGALKNKIEIQWSDITAIRAITPENQPGTLELELSQPPMFYREINPQPRKHTIWQQSSDFTGGQAPTWRRHHVSFPPGILDKHYERLLQCDQRLLGLTENPFPAHDTPFYNSPMFDSVSQHSRFFNGSGSNYQSPYNSYPTTLMASNNAWSSLSQQTPNPTMADAGNSAWSSSASNPALMPGNNAWSTSAPNPTMPGNNNPWASLHQPTILEAMDYSYTNSNNQLEGCYEPNYEANVGGLGGIDQQQFVGAGGSSSHMEMMSSDGLLCSLIEPISTNTTTYPYAQTTSDQMMPADNYYNNPNNINMDEVVLYSEPQPLDQTQHVNWMQPPHHQTQQDIDALLMEQQQQQINNATLPPYYFQGDNSTNGRFF